MSKETAIGALVDRVSKSGLEEYTDVVYVDVTDNSLNGINDHELNTTVHGIPVIVADVQLRSSAVREQLDTKLGLDYPPFAAKANVSGDTFTGPVRISLSGDALVLNGIAETQRTIKGKTSDTDRWGINIADQCPESGGNEGSNFSILRFSDSGEILDSPFGIDRKTGKTYVNRINIGGTLMQSGDLDIRYQPLRPTNDLELGTMWIKEPILPV